MGWSVGISGDSKQAILLLEYGSRWYCASRKGISGARDMALIDMLVELWIACAKCVLLV